jgi:hypothetical protein
LGLQLICIILQIISEELDLNNGITWSDGNGPKPNRIGTYELVGFTKWIIITEENQTEFNTIERRFCRHNDWKLYSSQI